MKAVHPLVPRDRARRAVFAWVLASVAAVSMLLTATLAVGSALLANELLAFEPAPAGVAWRAAALCLPGTLLTALLCGWRCIRAERSRAEARSACLGWGAAGGVLVPVLIVLTFVFVVLVTERFGFALEEMLFMAIYGAVAAAVVGGFVGTPIGLVFGAIMIRPIRLGCDHRWAHDSADRSATVCGGWLAGVSGAVAAVLVLVALGSSPAGAGYALALALAWAVAGAAGLLAFLWGAVRAASRARWLARVRAGAERGWVVVELDDDEARVDRGLRPFQGGEPASARLALARLEQVPGGAYREVGHPVPVALVAPG